MIAAIVGCGDSANEWLPKLMLTKGLMDSPGLYTFGVNDSGKWGYSVDNLVVVNGPHKFTEDRLFHIKSMARAQFYTNLPAAWSKAGIANPIHIQISQFYGKRLQKDRIVFSKTSPFIAMSMAYNEGYDDIRLFGVDFKDHKHFKAGDRYGDHEIAQYAKFAELAAKECVKIRVTKESALSKFIDTI